jgi:hypothetical protein
VGTEKVYVSTMCGPYPASITDTSGTDPACPAALAAFAAGTVCGETTGGDDSGSSDGASGSDGGPPDAGSGDDGPTSVNDAGDSGDLHDANPE